jgi:hypothetical protein
MVLLHGGFEGQCPSCGKESTGFIYQRGVWAYSLGKGHLSCISDVLE